MMTISYHGCDHEDESCILGWSLQLYVSRNNYDSDYLTMAATMMVSLVTCFHCDFGVITINPPLLQP